MMTKRPSKTDSAAQADRPSILGMLYNPHLGRSIAPLRNSMRMFVHLIATVFSMYGLFPKDHPALRDDNASLSLADIFRTGWTRLQFTREGAPQLIMFFAVAGIMAVCALFALFTFIGLFVGKAHAADSSAFDPAENDVAQKWLDYLFFPGSAFPTFSDTYGNSTVTLGDPFSGGISLQSALLDALGFYSDAILIVAAIILFYHLASMIVETAHHGKLMGKNGNEIWAPIRLVVAIGLLVPINGQLNCGQYIVIKAAELGSGLASQTWRIFLHQLNSYNTQAISPSGPMSAQQVALDIIRMQACMAAWNYHVDEQVTANISGASSWRMTGPTAVSGFTALGDIPGTKYTFSQSALSNIDVCGWYFLPSGGNVQGTNLDTNAAHNYSTAITNSLPDFQKAGEKIKDVITPNADATTPLPASLTLDTTVIDAVGTFQKNVNTAMQGLATDQTNQMQDAINKITPYGWVMAGTFLNTVSRMQESVAGAARNTLPVTEPPKLHVSDSDKPKDKDCGIISRITGNCSKDKQWDIRTKVAEDMAAFDIYQDKAISQKSPTSDAQCAAMVGMSGDSAGWGSSIANKFFWLVDKAATANGVWQAGSSTTCGADSGGLSTFSLGITINGKDPFAQIAYLGHANINTAFLFWELELGAKAAGGVGELVGALGGVGKVIGGGLSLFSGIIGMFGPALGMIALVFWTAGFALAYMIPLMPFMRFFFAVLTWVAAIIEAIIGMPLVALAHLNPEGHGLPGNAQKMYYFVFDIFLRPVMTVFGLICGLVLFLIAISFLNYGYGIAVSGAGGTAYGLESLGRLIYSVLYVAIIVTVANQCFMLIDQLPAHALKWMNAGGIGGLNMDATNKIEGVGSMVAGYAGMQAVQAIGGVGKNAKEFAKPIVGALGDRLKSRSAAQLGKGQEPEAKKSEQGAQGQRALADASGERGARDDQSRSGYGSQQPGGGARMAAADSGEIRRTGTGRSADPTTRTAGDPAGPEGRETNPVTHEHLADVKGRADAATDKAERAMAQSEPNGDGQRKKPEFFEDRNPQSRDRDIEI